MDFSKRFSVAQNLASIADWRAKLMEQEYGWQLPCTVTAVDAAKAFVTVKFRVQNTPFELPDITIPIVGWKYIRFPVQVGDTGITMAADVDLTAISGLGSNDPDLSNIGNLERVLMFVPLMAMGLGNSPDPDAVVVYGPNGVILQDTEGNTKVTVSNEGSVAVDGNVFVHGSLSTTGNLQSGTGATGTFTAASGQTITVQNGIVIGIA
jgi:hypothetical protein